MEKNDVRARAVLAASVAAIVALGLALHRPWELMTFCSLVALGIYCMSVAEPRIVSRLGFVTIASSMAAILIIWPGEARGEECPDYTHVADWDLTESQTDTPAKRSVGASTIEVRNDSIGWVSDSLEIWRHFSTRGWRDCKKIVIAVDYNIFITQGQGVPISWVWSGNFADSAVGPGPGPGGSGGRPGRIIWEIGPGGDYGINLGVAIGGYMAGYANATLSEYSVDPPRKVYVSEKWKNAFHTTGDALKTYAMFVGPVAIVVGLAGDAPLAAGMGASAGLAGALGAQLLEIDPPDKNWPWIFPIQVEPVPSDIKGPMRRLVAIQLKELAYAHAMWVEGNRAHSAFDAGDLKMEARHQQRILWIGKKLAGFLKQEALAREVVGRRIGKKLAALDQDNPLLDEGLNQQLRDAAAEVLTK